MGTACGGSRRDACVARLSSPTIAKRREHVSDSQTDHHRPPHETTKLRSHDNNRLATRSQWNAGAPVQAGNSVQHRAWPLRPDSHNRRREASVSEAQHLQGDSTADQWNRAARLKSARGEGGEQKEESTRGKGSMRKETASNKQGAGGRERGRKTRVEQQETHNKKREWQGGARKEVKGGARRKYAIVFVARLEPTRARWWDDTCKSNCARNSVWDCRECRCISPMLPLRELDGEIPWASS